MYFQSNVPEKTVYRAIQFLLLLATVFVYAGLATNNFVSFDDHIYIYENPELKLGFTWKTISHAFSNENGASYWHPITTLSLMIIHQFFGLNPVGYHLVNLVFHCMNVLLLFHILRRTTDRIWPSALVSGLFALHPLNVESVAWAVELKTVLSAFFFFITILLYLHHVEKPSHWRFLAVSGAFALGLMAKPAIVMLPVLLLALDFWPLRRVEFTGCLNPRQIAPLLLEKALLCGLSIASLMISLRTFSDSSEAAFDEYVAGLSVRLSSAVVSYASYPLKMLWPAKLSAYYPLSMHSSWLVAACLLSILITTIFVLIKARSHPWLLTGWSWYLLMLLPVSGLVRKGLWPEMADRFVYLPEIGICIIIVWSLYGLVDRRSDIHGFILAIPCLIGLFVLGACTSAQVGKWHDTETLLTHSLNVTEKNDVFMASLGSYYCDNGDYSRGLRLLSEAEKINPQSSKLQFYKGKQAMEQGNHDLAERYFALAVRLHEADFQYLYFRAKNADLAGKYDTAIMNYNTLVYAAGKGTLQYKDIAKSRAVELLSIIAPDIAGFLPHSTDKVTPKELTARMAYELDRLGFYAEALGWYRKMESTGDENGWQILYNIGNVLRKTGKYDEAIKYYNKSIFLKPDNYDTYNNLGVSFKRQGRFNDALVNFDKAIALYPSFGYARFNRAKLLIALGRRKEAMTAFAELRQFQPEIADLAQRHLLRLQKTE